MRVCTHALIHESLAFTWILWHIVADLPLALCRCRKACYRLHEEPEQESKCCATCLEIFIYSTRVTVLIPCVCLVEYSPWFWVAKKQTYLFALKDSTSEQSHLETSKSYHKYTQTKAFNLALTNAFQNCIWSKCSYISIVWNNVTTGYLQHKTPSFLQQTKSFSK